MAVIRERSSADPLSEAAGREWRPLPITSPVHKLRNSLELSWNETEAVTATQAVTARRLGSILLLGAIAWAPLTTFLYVWSQ